MRITWADGLILNILPEASRPSRAERGLIAVARATLAAMTRSEAEKWAEDRIRINAVAPATLSVGLGPQLKCEPDIATLALQLASRRGENLSGHVFEAAGAG
jgi:3-oxoacyl-[acyl-carrier protein] reductase